MIESSDRSVPTCLDVFFEVGGPADNDIGGPAVR